MSGGVGEALVMNVDLFCTSSTCLTPASNAVCHAGTDAGRLVTAGALLRAVGVTAAALAAGRVARLQVVRVRPALFAVPPRHALLTRALPARQLAPRPAPHRPRRVAPALATPARVQPIVAVIAAVALGAVDVRLTDAPAGLLVAEGAGHNPRPAAAGRAAGREAVVAVGAHAALASDDVGATEARPGRRLAVGAGGAGGVAGTRQAADLDLGVQKVEPVLACVATCVCGVKRLVARLIHQTPSTAKSQASDEGTRCYKILINTQ